MMVKDPQTPSAPATVETATKETPATTSVAQNTKKPKPAPAPVAAEQPKPAPAPVAVKEQPKPAPAAESGDGYHILAKGESPASVAKKYKIPLKKLMEINHFTDKDVRRLQIGQKIKVKP